MSRSRSGLHMNKVEEFKQYCLNKGWVEESLKGDYEVLRMKHEHFVGPLIVHVTMRAKEHVTIWGHSLTMYQQYRRDKNNG